MREEVVDVFRKGKFGLLALRVGFFYLVKVSKVLRQFTLNLVTADTFCSTELIESLKCL